MKYISEIRLKSEGAAISESCPKTFYPEIAERDFEIELL
jgi:hypothetical protein